MAAVPSVLSPVAVSFSRSFQMRDAEERADVWPWLEALIDRLDAAQFYRLPEVLASCTGAEPYSLPMQRALAHHPSSDIHIRAAEAVELEALINLEGRIFATDRISPRSFRRFLRSPAAALLIARRGDMLAGYALVLFRKGSDIARLYSIAVTPEVARRGIGAQLLAAAEDAAMARRRGALRLEVHEKNAAAIARYQKSGYTMFGRHFAYYGDGGHALRFEKRLMPARSARRTRSE
jgi:ribosomal protein S18 acetylase RimI-like enzyme